MLLLFLTEMALACCGSFMGLEGAAAVFEGRVADRQYREFDEGGRTVTAAGHKFEVRRWWKGPGGEEVIVWTDMVGVSRSTDLPPLATGQTWVVYAYPDGKAQLWSNQCTRTTREVEREVAELPAPIEEHRYPPLELPPLERAIATGDSRWVEALIDDQKAYANSLLIDGMAIDVAIDHCDAPIVAALASSPKAWWRPRGRYGWLDGCETQDQKVALIQALAASSLHKAVDTEHELARRQGRDDIIRLMELARRTAAPQ